MEFPNRAYEDEFEAEGADRILGDGDRRKDYEAGMAERIGPLLGPAGRLLDIGAGTGGILLHLRDLGWTVEGIEPSDRLHEHAKSQLEDAPVHDCRLADAEDRLQNRPYDAIIAVDVIEHLPEVDQLPRMAFSWLAPGGGLFLQTPNAGSIRRYMQGEAWEQWLPDEHFIIHSKGSLGLLLEKSGFIIESIGTVSGGATDTPIMNTLKWPIGRILALIGMGNALNAVARKPAL